jgi:hypothetical protein
MAQAKAPLTNRKLAKQHGFTGVNLGAGMAFVKDLKLTIDGAEQDYEVSISTACDCSSSLPKLDDYVNVYLSETRCGGSPIVNSRGSLGEALDFADQMVAVAQKSGLAAAVAEFNMRD